MTSEIYWLHKFENESRIGIMSRPRGGEWLTGEIQNLKKQEISVLVSLLERSEVQELELTSEESISKDFGLKFINFPIPDRGIPVSSKEAELLINSLMKPLTSGETVVIYCRMGIGRSSIIAGAVLLKSGYRSDELITHISKVRRLKVPDTEEQVKWLGSI